MKKKFQIIWILLGCTCLYSCASDENNQPVSANLAFEVSTIESLKSYNDFISAKNVQREHILNFKRDKDYTFDQDRFSYLIETSFHSTSRLSKKERDELNHTLNHIGFNCFEEFLRYDAIITIFAAEVVEKTDFLDNDTKQNIQALEVVLKSPYDHPDKSCLGVFSACINNAQAKYTMNILLCAAGAIGVGSATAGWGGVIFQLACSGAAYWYFDSGLDLCLANYEDC